MATSFFITPKEEKGFTNLFVRLQSRRLSFNYKMMSNIEVDIKTWVNGTANARALQRYHSNDPQLWNKLDKIKHTLDSLCKQEKAPTKEQMRQIIDDIVYQEIEQEKNESIAKAKAAEEAAKKMTLNKYIDEFLRQITNGTRITNRGTRYSLGTIKAIKTCLKQFQAYQTAKKKELDFDDINMPFYYDFMAYLNKRNYNINSAGKIVKELKAIMAAAEADGHHHNTIYKNAKFKGNRVEVDTIYLTKEDLDTMMNADISDLEPAAEQARDIFMVGVWTAQRISDYNNISRDSIHTTKKHWIEELPDPEHEGETIPTIKTKEITYIDIIQKKTGAKVSIPCKKELLDILEKYDFQMPHLEDQTINRLIKKVAEKAGLTQPVTIETSNGGVKKKESIEKYKLVMSHTARRTGATLMYLAGIDAYDIIKITGHGNIDILKKYIKADHLDVVQKLTDKYDYFD